ncbi:MAG: fibronectin type III domain-containing protein [Pseudomonadota bacterium]
MKHTPPLKWLLLLALVLAYAPVLTTPCAHAAAVKITWDANTEGDLDGYLLYWGQSPQQFNDPLVLSKDLTSCRMDDLLPDTAYCFAMKAVNSTGQESPLSEVASARTNPEAVPGVPADWYARYGLDPNAPSVDALDPDRDGYPNLAEWEGDTDPTDCRSIPGPAIKRRIKATIVTLRAGCTMKAVDGTAGTVASRKAKEVSRGIVAGVVVYTYQGYVDVPCGLRPEVQFVDGKGVAHLLSFYSDPNRTFLTPYIKVSPLKGALSPIDLGIARYNKGGATCSKNPLTQVDRDEDGVADYRDPDYLVYLRGLS